MIALMYHDVVPSESEDSSGFPGGDAARYKLAPPRFADHLRAIRQRAGPSTTTAATILSGRAPDRSFLLTFDDGGASATGIADLLEEIGWVGHFFVTTDYIGRPGFLTAAAIRDLQARGHVVGSHSCSHPLRMSRCSIERLRIEWERSVATLADIVGEQIDVASVPGGDYSPAVGLTAAEAGIRLLFTSRPAAEIVCTQFGMLVMGRFAVRRGTSPGRAAAVAAGERLPRLTQLVMWDLRTAAKSLGGRGYLKIRHRWLGGSPDVRWGDGVPNGSKRPATDLGRHRA